jgi:hypothetical protein
MIIGNKDSGEHELMNQMLENLGCPTYEDKLHSNRGCLDCVVSKTGKEESNSGTGALSLWVQNTSNITNNWLIEGK